MSLNFITPWLLAGAGLIVVPILIHLIMRQQPKPLLFPAFRFLRLRHRTNLQKLRLRHLLLLAMRILLILFIAAALARPELVGGPADLGTNADLGVVLIFDTSPSMEYEQGKKSRLDEAKERALKFLASIPTGSRVAVLDTATAPGALFRGPRDEAMRFLSQLGPDAVVAVFDATAEPKYVIKGPKDEAAAAVEKLPAEARVALFEPGAEFKTIDEARQQIGTLRIREDNRPVTASLVDAYRTLEAAAPKNLALLTCVFSDRTEASWDPKIVARDLVPLKKRVEERLGRPIAGVYFDLSVPEPRGAAIIGVRLLQPGSQDAIDMERLEFGAASGDGTQVQAVIQATGAPVEGEAVLYLDGKRVDGKKLKLEAAANQVMVDVVTFANVKMGSKVHRGEVRLEGLTGRDPIARDNARYWSIVVPERKVLVIADEEDDTLVFRVALGSLSRLPVQVHFQPTKTAQEQLALLDPDTYQAVCLFNVAKPGKAMWEALTAYVGAGGGLLILPGDNTDPADYTTPEALQVMPARIVGPKPKEVRGAFLDPDYTHDVMRQFKEWERRTLAHWKANRIWKVDPKDLGREIAPYHTGDAALVERRFTTGEKAGGIAVLFTTAMYRRDRTDDRYKKWTEWNNYQDGTWFYLALPYLTLKHVLGARAERQNFQLGDDVRFYLPLDPGFTGFNLQGPDLFTTGLIEKKQEELVIREASRPGNYHLSGSGGASWQRYFSVNLPPVETQLVANRPRPEDIESLFGEKSVATLEEEPDIAKAVQARLGQSDPFPLLPFLMIGLLLLLAGENLLANRFYRQDADQQR